MLWADTRVMRAGPALALLLGNSGPSIARKVKVIFDQLRSLAPAWTMQWTLGADRNAVDWVARTRTDGGAMTKDPSWPHRRSSKS